VKRWLRATGNSLNGLGACAETEAAFREEIVLLLLAVPLAFVVAPDAWRRLFLLAPIFLLLIVELLNTAIEKLSDRLNPDYDPAIGRIKDMGSAAIGLTLAGTVIVWAVALAEFFGF
jgi:diacylglycerol kinase (ATP)